MTQKPGVGPFDGIPTAVRFGIAGASGISAWMFVHPMDVLKVGWIARNFGASIDKAPTFFISWSSPFDT